MDAIFNENQFASVPISRKIPKTTYDMINFGHILHEIVGATPLNLPNRRHYLQFSDCTLKGIKFSSWRTMKCYKLQTISIGNDGQTGQRRIQSSKIIKSGPHL